MLNLSNPIRRRSFLGTIAASAALGTAALNLPMHLMAQHKEKPSPSKNPEFEKWLSRIKGKHRQVYDAPSTNGGLPLAWARVFLMSNQQLGVPDKEITSVLVLRHDAIPFVMKNELWEKYQFGETFNVTNMMTRQRVTTNIFWQPKEEFPLPGMSLDKLLESGVLVGVCDLALTFNSMHVAQNMKMDAAEVKKDWVAGIFPGVQIVPSGVLAINRAQEHGCTYCYAGEG
jgi:intracellular sulfur oxidation DsrE/DsrF family protein